MEGEEELRKVVERLRARFRLHAVMLFGSRSRGDWGPWSDYDLLVIADFKDPYLQRIATALEALEDVRLPVELHPYTPEEAVNMLERGNPTIIDALEEGVVLYGGPVLEKLRRRLRELKERGLTRTGTSIKVPR